MSPSASHGSDRAPRTGVRSRAAGAALVAILVTMAVGAGVVAGANGIQTTASDGKAVQAVESALGANDLALKALGQAVLIAEDRDLGVAGDDVVAAAIAEARVAGSELQSRLNLASEAIDSADPAAASVAIGGSVGDVIEMLETRDTQGAATALVADAKPVFESTRDLLVMKRDEVAASLEDAASAAGWVGRVGAALIAFLIPAGVILAYRGSAKRQLKVAQLELDARLSAEREVTRAKDEFIANISHELRTPLTSIYGFSEVLLDEGLMGPDAGRELVELINRDSAELARMVEDLLVAARVAESTITYDLRLTEVGNEIKTVTDPLVRLGASVAIAIDPANVLVDRLRFRQVIRNLVANANAHGGPNISITGSVVGDAYEIVVADDGPGVPDELRDKLFTRFVHETSKALTVGSVGLGLAVADTLARGQGGGIEYRRRAEMTEFVLTVPIAPAAAAVESSEVVAAP